MDKQGGTRNVLIGRYNIIDEIGSGGFSNVYRAHDPVLDREVAIKVMRPFLMSEPEFVNRFQREAKTAANLDHPHIVPIYDHGEKKGRLYIVMKLIPNGSLAIPLANGPLPWKQVVSLAGEIAAALDYAHERGLVHRDIKPDNVLLTAQGQAQVTDFGVVKALEKSTTTLSLSGGILGTPAYVAPEIWNGKAPTGAADIYALTCLVFEMITGKKLFDAPTPPAAMALHFRPRKYPEVWPENTPPNLRAVLERGLAQDPEERYATATELAEALGALEEDPLAKPYAALLAAIDSENWPVAVELAESIGAQDEDYKDVRQLMARATRARGETEKKVWVDQWRSQAVSAANTGEWELALTAARQWLQLSPGDAQAQAVIDRATEELKVPDEPPPAVEHKESDERSAEIDPLRGEAEAAIPDARKPVSAPPTVSKYISDYMLRLRSGDLGSLPAVILLVFLVIFFQATSGIMREPYVIANIIADAALVFTVAIGVFFVLLLGEIDLSVASIVILSALVLAFTSSSSDLGLPALIAILAALLIAALAGFLQGLVISRFDLPSYMVTLTGLVLITTFGQIFAATGSIDNYTIKAISDYWLPPAVVWILAIGLTIAYGALQLSGWGSRSGEPETATPRAITIAKIALLGLSLLLVAVLTNNTGLPLIAPIFVAIVILFSFVSSRTKFGRSVYAVGRDRASARQAGINVGRTRLLVFTLAGLMAGLGGIIWASRFKSIELPYIDPTRLLMVIAAAVIGGTSVFGGRGRLPGVLLGALVVAVINVGWAIEDWTPGPGNLILGLVTGLFLVADGLYHRRQRHAVAE